MTMWLDNLMPCIWPRISCGAALRPQPISANCYSLDFSFNSAPCGSPFWLLSGGRRKSGPPNGQNTQKPSFPGTGGCFGRNLQEPKCPQRVSAPFVDLFFDAALYAPPQIAIYWFVAQKSGDLKRPPRRCAILFSWHFHHLHPQRLEISVYWLLSRFGGLHLAQFAGTKLDFPGPDCLARAPTGS